MQLLNFRMGFASNSSSYHSTIIAKNKADIKEYLPEYLRRNKDGKLIVTKNFDGFGWEDFIFTEKDTIDLYIAVQIYSSFPHNTPNFIRLAFIQQVLPHTVKYLKNFKSDYFFGIDHQSIWSLPSKIEGPKNVPDIDFVKELINYIHSHDIVIQGGNDNNYTEEEGAISYAHIKREDSKISYIPKEYKCDYYFSYKDGHVWILFEKETGKKIRFSFEDKPIKYEKSSKPELVDLIISNRCANNCDFCYRDCTPDKKDASLKVVKDYIDILSEQLFIPEIIIGGGDIITYPYLEDLCDYINYKKEYINSVFNTTINLNPSMLKSSSYNRIKLILDTFNGVAVSVPEYTSHLNEIAGFLKAIDCKARISFQMIPELQSNPIWFLEILEKYPFPVTLLGFKECGRGSSYLSSWKGKEIEKTRDNANTWIKYAEKNIYHLGVDTQFIKNFPKFAKKWDSRTYTREEGKFSCCIDATDNTISCSSYSGNSVKLLDTNSGLALSENILEIYKTY